jgi:hypothetical protein
LQKTRKLSLDFTSFLIIAVILAVNQFITRIPDWVLWVAWVLLAANALFMALMVGVMVLMSKG